MSIEAIAAVMELQIDPTKKWVLVCLADHANKDFASIFPSVETVCHKSCVPKRTVQRCLSELRKEGILEVINTSRPGRGTEYRLILPGFEPDPIERKYEPSCPPKLRTNCIRHFEHVCQYCKKKGTVLNGPDGQFWTIDRIVPGSKGGIYTPSNITLACRACNTAKGTKDAPSDVKSMDAKMAPMPNGSGSAPQLGTDSAPQLGTQTVSKPSYIKPSSTPDKAADAESERKKQHPKFIDLWTKSFKSKFGRDYVFNGGRDARAVKDMLSATKHTAEYLADLAWRAWQCRGKQFWNCEKAITIHYFAAHLNEIMAELGVAVTTPGANGEDDHEARYGFPRGSIPLSQRPPPGEDGAGNRIGADEYEKRFPLSLYDHDK